jgi:hypothetical protein
MTATIAVAANESSPPVLGLGTGFASPRARRGAIPVKILNIETFTS